MANNNVAVEIKENDSFFVALKDTVRLQRLIDDGEKKVQERKSAISGGLFTLAKEECAGSVQNFLSRCENAESRYKESTKGAKIPKQWSQAKSNIKAALNEGIDLHAHETESSMRKAMLDARKAKKEEAEKEKQNAQNNEPLGWVEFRAAEVQIMLGKIDEMGRSEIADPLVNDLIAQLGAICAAVDIVPEKVIEGEVVAINQ